MRQAWMTEEVLNSCDRRREAKRKTNRCPTDENKEEYRRACRKVKEECRRAKRRWIEEKCKNCEAHFRQGSSRPLFRTVKELTANTEASSMVIKNDQGEKVADEKSVSKAWREHFKRIYDVHTEVFSLENFPQLRRETQAEATPPIIGSEVRNSIRGMSSNKAPGKDGVTTEMLRAGGRAVEEWLTKLCNDALHGGMLPSDWTASEIVPLFKKGDKTERNNYRPISLLSHSYKIIAKILQKRLELKEEAILNEEQAGFRTGRGTTDQIFSFSQLTERMWERNKDVFCLFIDFEKAFDSVWRPAMEAILEWYGFDSDIIKFIRGLNTATRATVRKGRISTDEFPTRRGVLPGCPLSPHPFNIFLEYVMRESLGS